MLALLAVAVIGGGTLLALGADLAGVRQRLLVACGCGAQVVLLLANAGATARTAQQCAR